MERDLEEGMGESAFSILIQSVPLMIVFAALAVTFARHYGARQQQAQGVVWLQALRMLITHVQRHRGLSSGFLAGDRTLQESVKDAQLQVSRDFDQIGSVGEWIKHSSSWQGITQHWARLAGNIHQLTVPSNMDQHNRLIKNILVLIDDIALAHYLHGGTTFKPNIWRDLLTLAEYIGQMRVLGMVVAARTYSPDDSAYLKSQKELQALEQEVLATLDLPRYRNALDGKMVQDTLDFLTYVDKNIVRDGPQVIPAEFYRVATDMLDLLYERFDQELTQVNRRLGR
jgi:Nitrate and nitrite sensing